MNSIKLGVDIGNSDTKTQHCTIASGYKTYDVKPELARNVLAYNGKFYVPDKSERLPYTADKTENDQCLILTLFGIAEELIFLAKSEGINVQDALDEIETVRLGVGLPPGHFNLLANKTLAYYKEKLAGNIEFTYKGFYFSFEVEEIRIFPQDFMAVYKNKNCETAKKKQYYIIGIGGGTIDIVPVVDGEPDVNNCFSLEKGTRVMFSQICSSVQRQFGVMLDEKMVENVLRDEETELPESYIQKIKQDTKTYFNDIIKFIIQQGVKLEFYPAVFFGGGGVLLKDFIKEENKIRKYEIINDVNANAKAYAICL